MANWTSDPLALVTIAFAVIAAGILVWFLARRPPLGRATKVSLLLGIGILPIASATTGNLRGYEETKARRFCSGCHVMGPHTRDSADLTSMTLAAQHARNSEFGGESCYACHRDYGMFGTVATKIGGLRHVWAYLSEFHDVPVEEAMRRIHLYRPYPNQNCVRCHSTVLAGWKDVADHASLNDEIQEGNVSCASAGCHGPAHPFSKGAR